MKAYLITERAGRRVAGQRNNGVGTLLFLDELQAAEAVEAGHLVEAATDAAETPEKIAQDEMGDTAGGKGSRKAKKAPDDEKTGV